MRIPWKTQPDRRSETIWRSFPTLILPISLAFLSCRGGPEPTPEAILQAARDGEAERVGAMGEANPALVGARDGDGKTPLLFSAREGHTDLLSYVHQAADQAGFVADAFAQRSFPCFGFLLAGQ